MTFMSGRSSVGYNGHSSKWCNCRYIMYDNDVKEHAVCICIWMTIWRGPPWCVLAYKISKSTGFQNGFLDFKVDFGISKWISGFQSSFLDFIWTSIILKIQLKYTHEQSMNHIPLILDANRIQCQRHFTTVQRIGCVFIDCHTHTCHTVCLLIVNIYMRILAQKCTCMVRCLECSNRNEDMVTLQACLC